MEMFFDAQRKLFPVNQHRVDGGLGFGNTVCGQVCGQTRLAHVIPWKCLSHTYTGSVGIHHKPFLFIPYETLSYRNTFLHKYSLNLLFFFSNRQLYIGYQYCTKPR